MGQPVGSALGRVSKLTKTIDACGCGAIAPLNLRLISPVHYFCQSGLLAMA